MSDSRVFLGRAVQLSNPSGPTRDHITIEAKDSGDADRSWTPSEKAPMLLRRRAGNN